MAGEVRTIRGVATPVTWAPVGPDGDPADPGTVTVTVTRADGATLITGGATTGTGTNPRTFTLTAAQCSTLDRLTVVWTVAGVTVNVSTVTVSDGLYFPNAALRAQPGLASPTTYPAETLAAARTWFEDLAERHIGVAFVGRYWRGTVCFLPIVGAHPYIRTVREIVVDGVAQSTVGWLTDGAGRIWHPDGTTHTGRTVTVAYEHGWTSPPADLVRAAVQASAYRLLGDASGISARATGVSNEFGNIAYSTATADRPTGLPEVDAVLNGYRDLYFTPGIA